MGTITLNIPDSLASEHDETVRFIAAMLYDAQKITMGQAAKMCGMEKWDFPAVLASFNVSYFQYTGEDLIAEFEKNSEA